MHQTDFLPTKFAYKNQYYNIRIELSSRYQDQLTTCLNCIENVCVNKSLLIHTLAQTIPTTNGTQVYTTIIAYVAYEEMNIFFVLCQSSNSKYEMEFDYT